MKENTVIRIFNRKIFMGIERNLNLLNELVKIADGVINRRADELWEYIVPHLKEAAFRGKYVAVLKVNAQEFNINDALLDALSKKCNYHGIKFDYDYSLKGNNERDIYSFRLDFKKSNKLV